FSRRDWTRQTGASGKRPIHRPRGASGRAKTRWIPASPRGPGDQLAAGRDSLRKLWTRSSGAQRRFAPACSRLSRRRTDWQSYFYYLVANTKENDRAGQYRQRTFQSWHKVGNGNDGGSRPPPRGSHGTRAAVLQSTEKDGDTGLDGSRKNVPNEVREPY